MAATILIVDDSRTVRTMVRTALEVDRHRVLEAVDGVAALAALEREAPDLVITDVNMPEMDGLRLVEAIRRVPRWGRMPILILSTEYSDTLKQRGRAAGATGWLVKPFDPGQLRQVVARVTPGAAS
jgi:two-component system chemotaxis response regulator CheY